MPDPRFARGLPARQTAAVFAPVHPLIDLLSLNSNYGLSILRHLPCPARVHWIRAAQWETA